MGAICYLCATSLEGFLKERRPGQTLLREVAATCMSLRLRPSLSGRGWTLAHSELGISVSFGRTPERAPPAEG